MPLNIPTGDANNISFGPAKVYFGDATPLSPLATVGTTPLEDVGYIGEDGVSLELGQEVKNIRQGNPSLIEYSFYQQQSATITFTSIEWDFAQLSKAVGATYTIGSPGTFGFGGKALATLVGIKIEHQMAVTGNTMNIFCYRAQSESSMAIQFNQDEHQFPFTFNALRATQNFLSSKGYFKLTI